MNVFQDYVHTYILHKVYTCSITTLFSTKRFFLQEVRSSFPDSAIAAIVTEVTLNATFDTSHRNVYMCQKRPCTCAQCRSFILKNPTSHNVVLGDKKKGLDFAWEVQ